MTDNLEQNISMDTPSTLLIEMEKYLSLKSLTEHPERLEELDENGYIPISSVMRRPFLVESKIPLVDVITFLSACPMYTVSEDFSLVRLFLPIERHTIILRDVPEATTEHDIASLFTESPISMKPEVGNCWFISFGTEEQALEAVSLLQTKTLLDQPIKARIKSEFYMKELLKRIAALKPAIKLSGAASPFVSSEPTRKMSMNATPFTPSVSWGHIGLPNGLDFGYYGQNAYPLSHSSLPLIFTSPNEPGYHDSYIRYSVDEIYSIVNKSLDLSLPLIDDDIKVLGIMLNEPNMELVEKGRTMSIDQVISQGMPRTWSIDSIDYTNMVSGDLGDEVVEHLRKQRNHHKKRR